MFGQAPSSSIGLTAAPIAQALIPSNGALLPAPLAVPMSLSLQLPLPHVPSSSSSNAMASLSSSPRSSLTVTAAAVSGLGVPGLTGSNALVGSSSAINSGALFRTGSTSSMSSLGNGRDDEDRGLGGYGANVLGMKRTLSNNSYASASPTEGLLTLSTTAAATTAATGAVTAYNGTAYNGLSMRAGTGGAAVQGGGGGGRVAVAAAGRKCDEETKTGLAFTARPNNIGDALDNLVLWSRIVMKGIEGIQWRQVGQCDCVFMRVIMFLYVLCLVLDVAIKGHQ